MSLTLTAEPAVIDGVRSYAERRGMTLEAFVLAFLESVAFILFRIRPISPLSHLAFHVWRLMFRGRIPGARRWTRDAEKPATNHLTTHPPKESNQ